MGRRPVQLTRPRTKEEIEKSIKEFAHAEQQIPMLSDQQVREIRSKITMFNIKNFIKTVTTPTTMKDFEADLAERGRKATKSNAPLIKTKVTASKTPLPSFLTGPTLMSRHNKAYKIRDAYNQESINALLTITADNEIYDALVKHILREGKATNSVIYSFLANVENQASLTKGITNKNIHQAVKSFGQKLAEEDFVTVVQQGAVKVRKLNIKAAFTDAVKDDLGLKVELLEKLPTKRPQAQRQLAA